MYQFVEIFDSHIFSLYINPVKNREKVLPNFDSRFGGGPMMTVSSGKAASVPWPDKALAHGLPVQATNRTSLANSVCISSTKMLYSDKVNISSSRGLLRSPNKWIQNRGNSGNSVVKFQASIFPAVSRVQGGQFWAKKCKNFSQAFKYLYQTNFQDILPHFWHQMKTYFHSAVTGELKFKDLSGPVTAKTQFSLLSRV